MKRLDQIGNNLILDNVLTKFNKFYISSLMKEVDKNEILNYIQKARDKQMNELQIAYNIFITDSGKVSLLKLVKNEFTGN